MPVQQMTQIGTKRQLTLSKAILDRYGLGEGSHVILEMKDNHLELHPAVPVKRNELPEELREVFLSRIGAVGPAVPLSSFLDKIGYKAPKAKQPTVAEKALLTHAEAAKAKR